MEDAYPGDKQNQVSIEEIQRLLEHRKPLADFGMIGSRKICHRKSTPLCDLIIFDGNHEMLVEAAFQTLVQSAAAQTR